jgi:dinuclear metal center YbgI/SA1388 family protein
MKIRELLSFLEMKAPGALQESYDNSGLLVGNPDTEATSMLISLDCTEAVIEEAIAKGCNVILSHHPIVFSGLKRFTGKNYVERVVMKAIKHDIQLISYHTNLDNVKHGVNARLASHLGLSNLSILDPKKDILKKIVVYVPQEQADQVRKALWDNGAGNIGNYDQCSFNTGGLGTFRGNDQTNPFVGKPGELHAESEVKIEVVCPQWSVNRAVQAAKQVHPYEEMAYDIYPLNNTWMEVGSGMIGELDAPMPVLEYLHKVKKEMKAGSIRYTQPHVDVIRKVAICGGSGSFLLDKAMAAGADLFITSDYKYHQFFDADQRIIIADIGHFETEQYTIDLLSDWFAEKFPTFATHKTGVVTNPINYL